VLKTYNILILIGVFVDVKLVKTFLRTKKKLAGV
jgi:hypothetical protein